MIRRRSIAELWEAELIHSLEQALIRMDRLGYPPARRHTGPIDDRPAEPAPAPPEPTPPPKAKRRRAPLRVAVLAGAVALAATACTPEQLETFRQETGIEFDGITSAALVAADDTPLAIGDGRSILADGTLVWLRAGHCDQWRAVAIAAGWAPAEFDAWASRIIYRESRCNPSAVSRTHDSGLFQINRIVLADMRQRPALWAEAITKLGGVPSLAELLEPMTNAIVAEALFDIRGTAPWK